MSAAVAGCSRSAPPREADASDVAAPAASSTDLVDRIARAEDVRRVNAMPANVQAHHDPEVRRASARALARILDADDGPLLRALEDEDSETVAWAGYGLGESCKGREEAHVSALASRLTSLDRSASSPSIATSRGAPPSAPVDASSASASRIDPFFALVRALGRCGGPHAEAALRAWLTAGGAAAEAAAYSLGDLAARLGSLTIESSRALLDASSARPPVAAALYALARGGERVPDELAARLASVARGALGSVNPERVFAVRALGYAGLGSVEDAHVSDDLARIFGSDDFTVPERVEATRALAGLHAGLHAGQHEPGQAVLAEAVAALLGRGDPGGALAGDRFSVLSTALNSIGDEAAVRIQAPLWTLARLTPDRDATAAVVRRASALRCAAAEKLARGAWDSDVLRTCDLGDGEAGESARLASLDRGPLVRARRAAWVELTRSVHVRVREAALGAIARHPEVGDVARAVLAQALASDAPGVVATAATVVEAHPDRVFVIADSARRAALDPASPLPRQPPAREVDATVAAALRAALARPWTADLVETRMAVLDAAVAAGLDEARAAARTACGDPNGTVRAHAVRALAALGSKGAACPASDAGQPAPELGHTLEFDVRMVLDTDAGKLAIRFDPALAPIAVTRVVALARSGFYDGVAVHRVVPGFVVQFGDQGGDGFGGGGALLRCETSPVPFEPLDVGVALAGRDTGSTQMFVTLARSPHLDGEYAWIGRAEGDWNAVTEGDVIRAVHVDADE